MRVTILTILLLIIGSKSWGEQNIKDFRLKDLDNHWQQLSNLKGEKLTVIDFWTTWCSPCTKGIPKLNALYNIYHEKGVQFIGLNIDSPKNNAKIKPFVNAYNIVYPVLKDPNSQVASRLNVSSVPTLLIINSNNEIVFRHIGYNSGDEIIIEEELKKLLGKNLNE